MQFKTGIIFVTMLLMALIPAYAASGLASCWTPSWLSNISAYSFVTDIGNYNVTPYTINLVDGDFSSAVKTRLGVTGMIFQGATQMQDAELQRGFAGLWYDTSVGKYYAVFQYYSQYDYIHSIYPTYSSNIMLAIPNLSPRYVGGSLTYYYKGVNATSFTAYPDTAVFFYDDGGGVNFTGVLPSYSQTVSVTERYYQIGNSPITQSAAPACAASDTWLKYTSTGWAATDNTTSGYKYSYWSGCGGGAGTSLLLSSDGITFYDLTKDPITNSVYVPGNSMSVETFSPPYLVYGACSTNTGTVNFNVYEGATGACAIQKNLPDTTCYVGTTPCTAPYTASTIITKTETSPNFYPPDMQFFDNTHMAVHPIPSSYIESSTTENQYVSLFFDTTFNRSLTIYPWNTQDCFEQGQPLDTLLSCGWESTVLGTTAALTAKQLHNYGAAWQLRYSSPTGNVGDLNNTLVNTTFYTLLTTCQFNQKYNITEIVGVNSTHWKKSGYTCDGTLGHSGVVTPDTITYSNDLATLLTGTLMKDRVLAKATQTQNFGIPMYLDYETQTLNRFFYYEQFFPAGTSAVYERDMMFKDNENFQLTYNYTQYNAQTCSVSGLAYDTYTWSCQAPNASYIGVGNTSGYITVATAQSGISAVFQRMRDLNISINTKRNGISSPNIMCIGTSADSSKNRTSSSIYTCNWAVPGMSNESVTMSSLGKQVSTIFPIGDYYNSQMYGDPKENQTFCDRFDGVYRYSYDLDNYMVKVNIRVLTTSNAPISGATVYMDSVTVGGTDISGLAKFDKQRDFTPHNLTAMKVGYITQSVSVSMFDLDTGEYKIYLAPDMNSPFAGGSGTGSTSTDALFGLITSKVFVSMLIMLAALGTGMQYGGGLGGGIIACVITSAALFLLGFLDIAILLPVGFALVIFGAYTMTNMLGGKG